MADPVIYVIGEDAGPQKIGFSASLDGRLRTLRRSHGKGIKPHFTASVAMVDIQGVERLIHYRLSSRRLDGEWFSVTTEEAIQAIGEGIAAFNAGDRAPSCATHVERVSVMMTPGALANVDRWRAGAPGRLRNRSEAIRDLVSIALGADTAKRDSER